VDLLVNVTCVYNGGQSHVFCHVLYLITKGLLYFNHMRICTYVMYSLFELFCASCRFFVLCLLWCDYCICVPVWASSFACRVLCCWICCGLSCYLIAVSKQFAKIDSYFCYVIPSIRMHDCLPVWNIAGHTGRNFVTFILDTFTKVYWNKQHFGESIEHAGQFIVRSAHIWYVWNISTNILDSNVRIDC
jgi:hypothetical protein